MMTQPTVVRLIELIRVQLRDTVGPALVDDGARSTLGMIDHLLQTIQTRAEHEIEWMVSHAADVIALAERAVGQGDVSSDVASAVSLYKLARTGALTTSDVIADYARAASVLSLMLEETVGKASETASETATDARALLAREVQWGVDVVGDFVLVAP